MPLNLTIIRGPAGSGKSTIARYLGGIARVNWFEADMWFERNGHYDFEALKLFEAHNWCQKSVEDALVAGKNVIVSNTACSLEELNAYIQIAERAGAEVDIIRSPGPWNSRNLKEQNVHNVPLKSLERMINRYVAHSDEIEWSNMEIFNG